MVNQGKALVDALLGQVPAQYSTCPIIRLHGSYKSGEIYKESNRAQLFHRFRCRGLFLSYWTGKIRTLNSIRIENVG